MKIDLFNSNGIHIDTIANVSEVKLCKDGSVLVNYNQMSPCYSHLESLTIQVPKGYLLRNLGDE